MLAHTQAQVYDHLSFLVFVVRMLCYVKTISFTDCFLIIKEKLHFDHSRKLKGYTTGNPSLKCELRHHCMVAFKL